MGGSLAVVYGSVITPFAAFLILSGIATSAEPSPLRRCTGKRARPMAGIAMVMVASPVRAGFAVYGSVSSSSSLPSQLLWPSQSLASATQGVPFTVHNRFKLAASTKQEIVTEVPQRSVSVILLAGGVGKRMEANMPKQYLPLMGQPIALHSFRTFVRMDEVMEIIVVCDPSYRSLFEEAGQGLSLKLKFALPGKERQDSVYSGLQEISGESELVCIHDSARPLVLARDVHKVLVDAWIHKAAVLGVRVKPTIKQAGPDKFVSRTLDRNTLWEMQTPQVIEPSLLREGFEYVQRRGLEVTDDVSIVEHLGHPVFITEGSYTNLKVTTPDDLLVAERILHTSPA